MKIGIMLRHYGQPGGIGVYTKNIVRALLDMDQENEYVLLYNNPSNMGTFSKYPNVREVLLRAPNRLFWDQITVPAFARMNGLDMLFNPKLSIPIFSKVRTVWVMHGAAQFIIPGAYPWYDRLYFLIANRLYSRRATTIVTMSEHGKEDIIRYMGAAPRKMHAIHESYNELCRVMGPEERQAIKARYNLPDHYFLFIGGISPLKNFGNILRAFHEVRKSLPEYKLVVVGFKRWKFSKDLALIDNFNLREALHFTDFIPDEDVPGMYNLAEALVFPTLYEGFGIPVLESMACGTPVIASKTGSTPEIAGDAAILVDPCNPEEIASAMIRVVTDHGLNQDLVRRGLCRVKQFSWRKCASETLKVFESVKAL